MLRIRLVLLVVLIPALSSCYVHNSSYSSDGTLTIRDITCNTQELNLNTSVIGLFIGVSNYGEKARVYSTPAHAISAAVFQEPFYVAVKKYEDRATNELILGQREPIVFKPHTKPIKSVQFSNDDNRIIISSYGGTATLIYRSDYTFSFPFENSMPVNSAEFSPDGLKIVTSSDDGTARIYSAADRSLIETLNHPDKVRHATFHPGGEYVLTTCNDGAVRIWPIKDSGLPAEIRLGCCESGTPTAGFISSGNKLYVNDCGCLNIYDINDLDKPVWSHEEDDLLHSVSFNRDGSRFVTASWDGTTIWSAEDDYTDIYIPTIEGDSDDFFSPHTERAVISPDGRYVAISYSNGPVQLWDGESGNIKTIVEKKATSSLDSRFFVNSINNDEVLTPAFSPDGKRLLLYGYQDNHLTVLRLDKGERPIILRKQIKETSGDFRRDDPVDTASFDNNGSTVAVGYYSGEVRIYPAKTPDLLKNTPNKLSLLADLRMDPNEQMSKAAAVKLSKIKGAANFLNRFRGGRSEEHLNDDGTWNYIGDGRYVTKVRITDALSAALEAFKSVKHYPVDVLSADMEGNVYSTYTPSNVLMIIYISAHGWIGPDGKKYLLPADADFDDPDTWISYNSVLEAIGDCVGTTTLPGYNWPDISINRQAIVVFDTCQISKSAEHDTAAMQELPAHDGVLVVESTSPGQYAWHWTASTKFSEDVDAEGGTWYGPIYIPDTNGSGKFENELCSNMSIVPIASEQTLSDVIKIWKKSADQGEQSIYGITVNNWLDLMKVEKEGFLHDIPEVEQSGVGQDVTVHNDRFKDVVLFISDTDID